MTSNIIRRTKPIGFPIVGVLWTVISIIGLPCTLSAQDEIVFAERGGVQLVSVLQPSPGPGLLATNVVVRSLDPDHQVVTFENLSFQGDVHQVWPDDFSFACPSCHAKPPEPGSDYGSDWSAYDSHLVIHIDMVGAEQGGYIAISETNDGSTSTTVGAGLSTISINDDLTIHPRTGFGDIRMRDTTDAFYVVPQYQTNSVDLAYVVTHNQNPNVLMTVGILGDGFVHAGQPGGADFGIRGNPPVVIPFVPEPRSRWAFLVAIAGWQLMFRKPLTHSSDGASVESAAKTVIPRRL